MQTRAHRCGAIGCGAFEAVANQLIAAGNQGQEAFVERSQIGLYRGRGDAHQHLADFNAVRADRRFKVINRRIVLCRIQHFIQRTFALPLLQQGLVDRVFAIEVTGQMLASGVVVDHEQHIGIALGAPGKLGQGRHVAVPHGAGCDRSQQLGHVIGRILQILFQRRPQLRLFVLQARRQTGGKTLTGASGQGVEARRDFTSGLLQFPGEFLAVGTKAHRQIRFQCRDRAPRQGNGHQHLHQKGDTKGNEHGPQQTAL